jgi:hypothetical protein
LPVGERTHGWRDPEKKEEEKVGEKEKCCRFLVKNEKKRRWERR